MLPEVDKHGVHDHGAVEHPLHSVIGERDLPRDAEGVHHSLHRDVSALQKPAVHLRGEPDLPADRIAAPLSKIQGWFFEGNHHVLQFGGHIFIRNERLEMPR